MILDEEILSHWFRYQGETNKLYLTSAEKNILSYVLNMLSSVQYCSHRSYNDKELWNYKKLLLHFSITYLWGFS